MLRPQDNVIRECVRLCGIWRFARDAAGTGRVEEWGRAPLDARDTPVPAHPRPRTSKAAVRLLREQWSS